jgi:hypothetical protein
VIRQNLSRRNFLRGSGLIIASPAIIRVAKLMPISTLMEEKDLYEFNLSLYMKTSLPHAEWRMVNPIMHFT